MSVIFCIENIWKRILLFPLHYKLNFENFVMQLKRQSVEAWQNEKCYSKGNNTSENPIPRQEFSNQSTTWSTKVRGQVTTFVVCAVFSSSFQAVVLLTKTAINHRFLFIQVWGEWKDLKNSNGFELRNFYFTTVWKLFSKIFIRSGKMHHVELNSGTFESSK